MRGGMRNPMPEQPADVRNKNFKEVALGYDMKTAVDEAERCLHCPKPLCVTGCPVNVETPLTWKFRTLLPPLRKAIWKKPLKF